tara:strand:- start:2767 stop:3363 length:597 start_codon:yes stop_codon:yes gene_type:complete
MKELSVENISCLRGSSSIFKNLSFKVNKGQILQINGSNGSGKTSLLRIIAGFLDPIKGKINPEKNFNLGDIHFIGQKFALKKNLSVEKNLVLWSYLYYQEVNSDEILSKFELSDFRDKDIETLSDGQKRRLSLARLFIRPASIWLLDEVHVHLDQEWQKKLNQYIYNHANDGGIVLVSSNTNIELNSDLNINLSNYNV